VGDTTTFVCYICALDYNSSSLRLLYCRSNSENEPYYPQVEQQRPPPGASPISSGGMVQVCSHCYKCTRDKYTGCISHSGPEPPPKKRKSSRAASCSVPEIIADVDQVEDDGKLSPADVECPLCRRKYTVHSFKFLHSQGPPLGGLPYFPFLRTLPRLNDENGLLCDEDSQGRVRACQACHNSLINQWTAHQRDQLPIDERTYSYQSLVGHMSSGRLTPGDTRVSRATATPTSGRSLHSPGAVGSSIASGPGGINKLLQSENVRPRSNSNTAQDASASRLTSDPRAVTGSLEPRPRSNSNPHSPRVSASATCQPPTCHSPISVHSGTSAEPAHKPSISSFYCFLCGLHSELSFARMLYSDAQGKKAPFFPFMKHHSPKPRAEVLRDDGTALVCTFCYHSVMEQWQRYQDERNPISPALRKYNINDYVCFVCHIKTYRKRIRALSVMDYPFFRQHKQTKGTITMDNGELAAVCLDCFDNLKNQSLEAAKYGIPVEKRQYNWMQVPPPPEDGVQLVTPKERLDKQISVTGDGESETGDRITAIANNQHQKGSSDNRQRQAGGVQQNIETILVAGAAQVPTTKPGFAAALRDLAVRTVSDPAAVKLQHMNTTATAFHPVAVGGPSRPPLGLPNLPLTPVVPTPLSFHPRPGILPPSLPTSVPNLNHFRLEADTLYRAQLERYAAGISSSPYSSASIMSSFNPAILGHLLPQPPQQLRSVASSTITSGQHVSHVSQVPNMSHVPSRHEQVNHSKSQPGNANAPSSTFVPGRKGPNFTSRKNTVILVLLRDKTHDSTTETSTIEEDNYFDNHQSESNLSLSILITFSMFLQ